MKMLRSFFATLTLCLIASTALAGLSLPTYSSANGYISEGFITLYLDRALDANNPPLAGAFDAQINGTTVSIASVTVDSVAQSVRVTFTSATLLAGDIVDFVYTDPTGGDDVGAIQDTNGTDVGSFSHSIIVATSRPAPAITSVSVPANGMYAAGQSLDFTVNFSANVNVTGSPYLPLTVGSTPRSASYFSGSGSSTLTFRYTVQAGETDSDGIATMSPLVLNGGAIQDGFSQNAVLTFTPPNTSGVLVGQSVADALDTTGLTWTTGGGANWASQTSITHDGADAARSGAITHVQQSWMETTVTGPGTVTFWWKVSSEEDYDHLQFRIDGGLRADITGEVDWEQKSYSIPSGAHTLRWLYTKDGSDSAGSDAGWVDQVVFTPTPAPVITSVSVPANGAYSAGQSLDFTVNFNAGVLVDTSGGTPAIAVTVGSTTVNASYISGSGTSSLIFRYAVQAGNTDTDGITVGALSLNGGAIKDFTFTANAVLTLNSVGSTTAVLVDTTVRVPIDLAGSTTAWKPVRFGSTNQFDYYDDTQSGTADVDLVGNAGHPLIYTQYDNLGTASTTDDNIGFRIRMGATDSGGKVGCVVLIGVDADGDGDLDLLLSADGRPSKAVVKLWKPGTGANNSPNTTSIEGFTPNGTYEYAFTPANYVLTPVSLTSDPSMTNADLDADANTDTFVSFQFAFADMKAAMLAASGISIDENTPLRYVVLTSQQENSINGDIGGLNGGNNYTDTFTALGLFSGIISAGNTPPTITTIANQTTTTGTATSALAFTVGDAETAAGSLTVTAASDNTTLVPNVNLVLGGSGANRTITLTPAVSQTGTATITLTVTDAGGLTVQTSFTLTVNSPNTAPTLTAVSTLTGGFEDTAYTITYAALAAAANEADTEGDTLSFRIEAVSSGTLTKNGGGVAGGSTLLSTGESLVWTPSANANGTLNAFTVKAWDGALASATAVQVQVAVTPVNDAPSFTLPGGGGTVVERFLFEVPYVHSFTQAINGVEFQFSITPGEISLFNSSATDGLVAFDSGTVPVIIRRVDGGDFNPQSLRVGAGYDPLNVTAYLNEAVVGSTHTVPRSSIEGIEWAVIDFGGATVDEIRIVANTVGAMGAFTDFTFAAPAAADITVAEDSGAYALGTGFATGISTGPANESGQMVSFNVVTDAPEAFSVQPAIAADGTLTFTPAPNLFGTVTVTVTLQDNGGTDNGGVNTSAPQTFTITVTPVNDPPVLAEIGNQSTPEDTAKVLALSATDVDGDTLTYSATSANPNVTATVVGNQLTLTPAPNWYGTASITVMVSDGNGGTDEETFTLTVTPVNDPPVATADVATVNEDSSNNVINVLGNDMDVDGDTLTVTSATALHGTVSINVDGTLSYTPAPNFYGTDTITYVIRDPSGATSTATVTVTVYAKPINTLSATTNRVFQGQSLVFSATNAPANGISVADPDSTQLTVVLSVTNGVLQAGRTVGITFGNGVSAGTNTLVLFGSIADLNAALEGLIYTPATNYFGADFLNVATSDEGGRQDVDNTGVSLLVEVAALGGVPKVSLEGLNTVTRVITNVTGLVMETNLVQGISFDSVSNVVNVLPVGGQDGSTNRTSITVRVQFSDGTTQDVVVPVIIYQPLLTATTNEGTYNTTFGTPIFNPQTSLYEQKVSVVNNTPFNFTALRITATNLAPGVSLRNASLTNGSLVYIEYNLAVPSGSNVTLTLEYFSPGRTPIVPLLKLELLNAARVIPPPTNPVMTEVRGFRGYAPDGRLRFYMEFPTTAGLRYYVQYRDLITDPWKTSPVIIPGTGNRLNWLDEGAPNTDAPPTSGRFYRIVTGE